MPHPTSCRSILILSSHLRLGLPSSLFPSDFPTKMLHAPHLSSYVLQDLLIPVFLFDYPNNTGWGTQILEGKNARKNYFQLTKTKWNILKIAETEALFKYFANFYDYPVTCVQNCLFRLSRLRKTARPLIRPNNNSLHSKLHRGIFKSSGMRRLVRSILPTFRGQYDTQERLSTWLNISGASHLQLHRSEDFKPRNCRIFPTPEEVGVASSVNPSAWGHLNRSSYCDVGRLFYGVFKLWSKLCREKKW